MRYFASLLVRYENAVASHSLEFAAQNAMRYCLSATLVIIEHPDPCSTAESDTNNDLPVVCATKPVKPQSFYSQPKRRFNNGTPALVPGEQQQSMEVCSRPRQIQSRLHAQDGGGRMMLVILMTLISKPRQQCMKSALWRPNGQLLHEVDQRTLMSISNEKRQEQNQPRIPSSTTTGK